MKKVIIASVIVLALSYGSIWFYRQRQLLNNVKPKLINLSGTLNASTGHVIVTMQLTNNTAFDITVTKANVNVFLNSTFISTIVVNTSTSIKAKSSGNIDLVVDFDPSTVLINGLAGLLHPGNFKLIIQGSAWVITSFIVLNSLEINEEIPLTDIFK